MSVVASFDLAAYQHELAAAVCGYGVVAPAVERRCVDRLIAVVLRKRLAAAHALLPRTLATLGRRRFDDAYRAFALQRPPCGPQGYRRDARAFARTLGIGVAHREALALWWHDARARIVRWAQG